MTDHSLTPDEVLARLRTPIKIDPWKRDELFAGRPGSERMDCSVRAFVVATGKPYSVIHACFKAAGRKDGRKTPTSLSHKVAKAFGMRYVARRCRVSTLLNDMEHAKPVAVLIRGHMFGVAKGAVMDFEPVPPKCLVKGYFTY